MVFAQGGRVTAEGHAVWDRDYAVLREFEILDHILPGRFGHGDHPVRSTREAGDYDAGVVTEPHPKLLGRVQHAEIVDRNHARQTSADRPERGGKVEDVRARAPRRPLHARLVPPEVSDQRSGHGARGTRPRVGCGEATPDRDEALAQDRTQGCLEALDVASRAREVERGDRRVEGDPRAAHARCVAMLAVASDPRSQKKTYVSIIELKTTAVTALSRIPSAVAATTMPYAASKFFPSRTLRTPFSTAPTIVARCRPNPRTPSSTAYLKYWLSPASGSRPNRTAVWSATPSPAPKG